MTSRHPIALRAYPLELAPERRGALPTQNLYRGATPRKGAGNCATGPHRPAANAPKEARRNCATSSHRPAASRSRSPVNALPAKRYAPKAFDFPLTGFAPASRCAGTRSRAGSLYPTETIRSPWYVNEVSEASVH